MPGGRVLVRLKKFANDIHRSAVAGWMNVAEKAAKSLAWRPENQLPRPLHEPTSAGFSVAHRWIKYRRVGDCGGVTKVKNGDYRQRLERDQKFQRFVCSWIFEMSYPFTVICLFNKHSKAVKSQLSLTKRGVQNFSRDNLGPIRGNSLPNTVMIFLVLILLDVLPSWWLDVLMRHNTVEIISVTPCKNFSSDECMTIGAWLPSKNQKFQRFVCSWIFEMSHQRGTQTYTSCRFDP